MDLSEYFSQHAKCGAITMQGGVPEPPAGVGSEILRTESPKIGLAWTIYMYEAGLGVLPQNFFHFLPSNDASFDGFGQNLASVFGPYLP